MHRNKLGFYLKQYRKAEKLTQDDLARNLSVAKGTVSVWERDERLPETKMLIALSRMMKVTIDDVLGLKAT